MPHIFGGPGRYRPVDAAPHLAALFPKTAHSHLTPPLPPPLIRPRPAPPPSPLRSEPWRWLPSAVPPHASVVVSCLPDDPSRGASGYVLSSLRAGGGHTPDAAGPPPPPPLELAVSSVPPSEAFELVSGKRKKKPHSLIL